MAVAVPQRKWWEPEDSEQTGEQSFTEVSLEGKAWYQLLATFMGPGIMVAIAYIDPGNYATDLQAGTRFKYRLLWTVAFAHILGYIFQILTVKQTLATGRTLPEECRLEYPRLRVFMWLCGETASIAADLGYVMGTASAFQIMFGWPLIYGVLISIFDTFIFMAIQSLGHRKMELFCALLGGLVVCCCLYEICASGWDWDMLSGLVPFMNGMSDGVDSTPISQDVTDYAVITVGIVGASVVAPNFFLHSALTKTRRVSNQGSVNQEVRNQQMKTSMKFSMIETGIGIFFAFVINAIILLIAGNIYYNKEHPETEDDVGVFADFLKDSVGSASKWIFALSIFFGGQSASVTGTLASQYILEGFMNVKVKLLYLRLGTRAVSILPAFLAAAIWGDVSADVIDNCQVVVNYVVPFALIPILKITSTEIKMGKHKNGLLSVVVISVLVALSIGLNVFAIAQQFCVNTLGWIVTIGTMVPYVGLIAYLCYKPVTHPPGPDGLVQPEGKLVGA